MKHKSAGSRVGLAVKQDLLSRGINTKEAARILGISPAGVSVYFSGRPFSDKTAQKWANKLKLDKEFLVTGNGQPSNYVTMAVSPEEKKLILEMRKQKGKKLSSRYMDNIRLEQTLLDINTAVNNLNSLITIEGPSKR